MTKEELIKKKISAISLGCDKNRVDLEHMLYNLQHYGFDIIPEVEEANIIIVNTCAFIEPAIVEAIENIEYALSLKQNGKAEKIIVSGCLPMRDLEGIKKNYPNVDAFLTLDNNKDIISIIETLFDSDKSKTKTSETGRIITNQGAYAYLKIAEGCSNGCAYCTIPKIRGRFRSIPEKQILEEANNLAKMGYKELILVAQDTARYGEDIYGQPKLIKLLQSLVKIKGIEWIRLEYIYPEWVNDELLEFIVKNEKMCKYLDMPLQHIDDTILKTMNRRTGETKTRELVDKINEKYSSITIRSTFIVGFPTETKAQFNKLCNFISEGKIDYASFFAYSKEEKTKAYYLPKQVPNWIKQRRLRKITKLQNVVLNNINQQKIGQVVKVLIDEYDENEQIFIGHSQKDSPNIDLCVILENDKRITIGEFYQVKLTQMINSGFKGEIV